MRKRATIAAALGFVVISRVAASTARAALRADDLRCEDRTSPLAIDSPRPRLAWGLSSDRRGDRQVAYQVLVASTPDALDHDRGDLWDSGKVASADPFGVEYAGIPLASSQRCYWKARTWDANDRPSPWSEPAEWSMGILRAADWSAKWITPKAVPTTTTTPTPTTPTTPSAAGPSQPASRPAARAGNGAEPPSPPLPLFRRSFRVDKPVARAVAYVCGLGQFELHVNGRQVGDDVLQPGWTNYRKTCLYVAYDLTDQIKPGENAVGVMLGNGMFHIPPGRYRKFKGSFGPPQLIAQVELTYADGSSQRIATASSWKTAPGPITFSSIYGGEDYDARREQPGWDQPGFDDSTWTAAAEVPGPGGALVGSTRSAPPVRVAQVLEPRQVTEPQPGVFVYDLGQNCALIPRLTVRGPAGAQVRVKQGEVLGRDGTVSQAPSGAGAYCVYTLKGEGDETWSPRFFYYGSRYVQVQGAVPAGHANGEGKPVTLQLAGQFVTSSAARAGEFSCSNDLFNGTAALIDWAARSNTVSILTDCPHREKLGWLEEDHLMGPSLMYGTDMHAPFTKITGDMADAQLPSGMVPDIAPEFTTFGGGFRDSPEWGSACVLVPWQVYQWYGDAALVRARYDTMRRYVDYLGGKAEDGIVSYGLGDWYDLGPRPPGIAQLTPIPLTATAFYYRDLAVVAEAAELLGRGDDAADLRRRAGAVREAFNRKFYDARAHGYATGSQTANAIPLVFGLAPADDAAAILENVVRDVRDHKDGLTAGDVGYRYLLRALADGGRSDVIFDMNSRSDRPGYGYMLARGATSLTEAWDARESSSQDHFMLGHILEWFYGDLAGIGQEPDSVAFRKIRIRPAIVGDVTRARARYDSVRGPIVSSWRKDGNVLTLDVRIPVGATANVYLPTPTAEAVTESGKPADSSVGVKFTGMKDGAAVFTVESGSYSFVAPSK